MSVGNDLLLIDIGNSFIKYSFAHSSEPGVIKGVNYIDKLDSIKHLAEQGDKVLISAVGQSAHFQQIKQQLSGFEVEVVGTSPSAFGIEFAYSEIQTLGVDRWLAMIAAHKAYPGRVAVLSLGTAATCDVIDVNGQHLGGWIAPGFSTLRKGLLGNTEKVFSDGQIPERLTWGRDTSSCVNLGCLAMFEGFLLSTLKQLETFEQEFTLVISGGDRNMFAKFANDHTVFEENMVLKGLSYLG